MMGYLRYYLRHFIQYLTYPFRFFFRIPTEIISAPRYLMGLSLPWRVALILAVFIPVITLIAFFIAVNCAECPRALGILAISFLAGPHSLDRHSHCGLFRHEVLADARSFQLS